MRWLKYPWLLFGKLVALALIFIGGAALALLVLPTLIIIPGDQGERTQFLMHKFFRIYLKALQLFGLIRLEIINAGKLSGGGGKMVVANHPSLLDVVILMALIPRVQCIVKHEFWQHRFLGILMRQAGYIRNDLDPEVLVASCKTALDDGRCLIIFPEGTRTPPGTLPRFHRGFANVATLTGTPIQLVYITCDPPYLFKGEPWWHVPPKKPLFRAIVGECLDANSYLLYGQRGIAARKLVKSLELYYAKKIQNEQSGTGTENIDRRSAEAGGYIS